MITIEHKGNFEKTYGFLKRMSKRDIFKNLDAYGQEGVEALAAATPIRSGTTANSWGYEIHSSGSSVSIVWTNSNVNKGVPIAVIIQYGHGTGTGGYVQGIDYINPALAPVFDDIADRIWKEVTR